MGSTSRFSRVISCLLTLAVSVPAAASDTVRLMTSDHADAIYRRLIEQHWNAKTGLFRSFPDSTDLKLSQQASTYEQAAMGLLALRVGDVDRVRQLLEFFRGAWVRGPNRQGARRGWHGLVNFYNADFGSEGIEGVIHLGPNSWVGLLAARMANQTRDPEALRFALDIQYWVANSIPHDNGGVAMGAHDDPYGATWTRIYSTENNISYYAFLTELLRNPGLEKPVRMAITAERDHVENWLTQPAYDGFHGRMLRGVNPQGPDTIAALDTSTWLIAALGPKRLAARGINPDRLLRQTESTFEVTIGGLQGVDATDQREADRTYADLQHRADLINRPDQDRHRVIWFEGQGQYILAWLHWAEFLQKSGQSEKSTAAIQKAELLSREFDEAAIARVPNQSAYAYATPGQFYRFGWGAPRESKEGPASSLIAAVWRCFSGLGFDPLAGRPLAVVETVKVHLPQNVRLVDRGPAVLYGTSEDMVGQAWKALADKDWDRAIQQAEVTIQEWAPQARYLQKKKREEIGHLVTYSGSATDSRLIHKYWALNDVASAYYILGRAQDQKKNYVKAAKAFQQVVSQFWLAQIWDPQGWFWSPVDAITNDYVLRDGPHYGWVAPQAWNYYSSSRRRAL